MEEKIYRKIGKCLKEIRRQRGFTKKQVSKHLKISRRKLIRYEKGVEKISMDVLERLLTLYGFSYKEFLNYVRNPEMHVLISLASHKIADKDIEVIAHINQFVINLNLMYSLEKNK
jgi:transcriptional regulator with XRE-family HTH domain